MHSLFNILYTLCLQEWSCRDHQTWKLIISYSKAFKSFSHSWKLASDATSGSFEPKCNKHNLNKTEKVSLANKNRPGGDLEKICWMEMSMCLQISFELSNTETKKRNQEHLQLGKEDEHRSGKSCRRCCAGGDNKNSADVVGVFLLLQQM